MRERSPFRLVENAGWVGGEKSPRTRNCLIGPRMTRPPMDSWRLLPPHRFSQFRPTTCTGSGLGSKPKNDHELLPWGEKRARPRTWPVLGVAWKKNAKRRAAMMSRPLWERAKFKLFQHFFVYMHDIEARCLRPHIWRFSQYGD